MASYCLDTNHLSQLLNRASSLRLRIRASHRAGNRFGTCVPALCELAIFTAGSQNPEPCLVALRRLAHFIRVWPMDSPVEEQYAAIYLDVKKRGRIFSQVDMMLAAQCK